MRMWVLAWPLVFGALASTGGAAPKKGDRKAEIAQLAIVLDGVDEEAAVKAAADKGGKVLENKRQIGPYGYRAIVLDSEGNRIARARYGLEGKTMLA